MYPIPLAAARRRCRRLLTLACGLTPRPKGGETGDRRDPSPGLRVGASNSHSRSSLTARPRLFEGHHSLSSVQVAITATAALQNTAWGEFQRRFMECQALASSSSQTAASGPLYVHVFTLKLSPTPRRLQSPQEVRRTSVETSESCG